MRAYPLKALEPARKLNLLDLDQHELGAFFVELGEKAFRGSQIMKWVHHHGVVNFDTMTDLSLVLRSKLKASTKIELPRLTQTQTSGDGTQKWLLRLDCGNSIETVYIPEHGRGTLCVSSQVGCALDCSFCATGRAGFNRNLTVSEIVGQVWLAHQQLDGFAAGGGRQITNIVFMGMGEPLLNLRNLIPALRVLVDDLGYGLGKRRVTVSTAGVVPAIDRLGEAVDVSLAVSLHAPNDALRDSLVPLNRRYPIQALLDACKRFVRSERKKSVTFEYVMLDGVNDQAEHARELIRVLSGLPAKVNLIPFNSCRGIGYRCSSEAAIEMFRDILSRGGLRVITRKTRGNDIEAACGQLAGRVEDRSRRYRKFTMARHGEQL